MNEELRTIPLFEGLSDEEIQWLIDHSRVETLEKGAFFFEENQSRNEFYIMLEGELQVIRTINGRPTVLGTTPRGIIGGENAMLNGTPATASARAILPSRLLVFDLTAFRQIFTYCPLLGARVLQIATQRTQGLATAANQKEKLAAMGKLSAGLAHELNNPAAAARRAATTLRELLPALHCSTMQLTALGFNKSQIHHLITFQEHASSRTGELQLAPLEQSDRESEIGDWLDAHGIDNSWEIAPVLVSADIRSEKLDELAHKLPHDSLGSLLTWLYQSLAADELLETLEHSSSRISELVRAIKSYTYMDQGTLQEVDIHRDLENTLMVLGHKLKSITLTRHFASDLPKISGRGGELNQVWTNLIDNSIDALGGKGAIELTTRCEESHVMVEVADNGPGIPPAVMPHIFEPFFTTKAVGEGTGLGLDTSYRIVQQHGGTIEVWSEPGHTRFIVRLPINGEPS